MLKKHLMLLLIEKYSYSSDKTKIEENELTVNISLLKLNKMILSDHMNLKISDFIKEKVNKDNVLTFYTLAQFYKLASVCEKFLIYVERCFSMIVEKFTLGF